MDNKSRQRVEIGSIRDAISRFRLDISMSRMARMGIMARNVAADAKWEPPRDDRKEWRREKPDGTYEYRETPPEQEGVSAEPPEKEKVPAAQKPAEQKKEMESRDHVGDGLYMLADGDEFKEVVKKCAESSKKGASVEVKEKYPSDWKMFVSKDKSATVAVESDGSIVSVSKAGDSTEKHWAERAIKIAAQHGGIKLDCYDTVLPDIYSKAGMHVVARLPFDEKYAPSGWDYSEYKKYNNGKPDIVFMVYDGDSKEYNPADAIKVDSYEKGAFAQQEFLKHMKAASKRRRAMENDEKKEESASRVDALSGRPDEKDEVVIASLMKRFGWTHTEAWEELKREPLS